MCVYEFEKDEKKYSFQFGSYSNKDIKTYDLRPFKTDYTKKLVDNVGSLCRVEIREETKSPSPSKFKSLVANAKSSIKSFKES